MVVDQIDIAGRIRPFVITENQPPVAGDGQAPKAFQIAFQRMQLPAWEAAELFQRRRGFEGEQQLAQLICHRGRHSFGIAFFVELP